MSDPVEQPKVELCPASNCASWIEADDRFARLAREIAVEESRFNGLWDDFSRVVNQRDALNRLCAFNEKTMADLLWQRNTLLAACEKTLAENGHLADGDVCTLSEIKRAVASIKGEL